jgi:hypothetical protein
MISVEPLGKGWMVRSDQIDNALVFESGRRAETAARNLGERIAEAGEPAEIRIHQRGGALAGRFLCSPYSQGRSARASD